ncbi:MAG: type II secretion system protein [Alphaproteobacteria bacterium]
MRIKAKLNNRSIKGFTTVEIAIVVLISGILMAAFLRGYSLLTFEKDYKTTLEHIENLDTALNVFLQEYGRYPCPADPTLPPSHPDYGRETRCGNIDLTLLGGACGAGQRPLLQTSLAESNVICARNSARDIDGDSNLEYTVIGILPFRTLTEQSALGVMGESYREYMSFDGYDMRFTYAVTETMADRGRNFSLGTGVMPNMGAIKVVDENGIDVTIPDTSAHYVLVSHGRNKRGAYTAQGMQVQDCDFSSWGMPPPPGVDDPFLPGYSGSGLTLEIENCDHVIDPNPDNVDVVFRKAIRADEESSPAYFDDIVHYRSSYSTNLWTSARNTAGLPGQRFLYNTNIGDVGVGDGFNDPFSKLHVLGDIMIVDDDPTPGTSAPIIRSEDGYCEDDLRPTAADPSVCMQPVQIVGAGDTCGPGEVAVGMDAGGVLCEPLFRPSPSVAFDCGVDSADMDGDGDIIEPLFATGIVYDRSANAITPLGCEPL